MENRICSYCKSNEGRIRSLNGVDYCNKHYLQVKRHGEIINRTIYDKNEIIICDTYAKIILYNKKCIPISFTIIDIEDVDKIKNIKWYLKSNGYICHDFSDNTIYLHRYLMNPLDNEVVDHRNHNTLDNRKLNLRICSQSQNIMNSKKPIDNTSGVKGVMWDKSREKWISVIGFNGKTINLGRYKNKDEAIKKRLEASEVIFKEFRYEEGNQ
jgi:hypothetical protein